METPERGRAFSKLSKELPTAPESESGSGSGSEPASDLSLPPLPPKNELSTLQDPSSIPSLLNSPLPPLPKEAMTTMAIPRRPVGNGAMHSKLASVASVSSVYSDSPGFSRRFSNSSHKTKESLSGDDSEPATPPLPPKDNQRQQIGVSPKHVLASPATSFQSSPPRPELWRRRSVKSEKGLSVRELKLERSNGSTASPPPKLPAEQSQPEGPPKLPRSFTGRKPVPQRPAPPQPESMGNKTSQMRGRERSLSYESSNNGRTTTPPPQPSVNRLPTPDYLHTDKQQPIPPQMLSPVSPETPPAENRPPVPQRSESRVNLQVREPLKATANNPSIVPSYSHSRESSDTLTVTTEYPAMRSPQPKKSFAAKILTPQPSPSPSVITSPLELPSPIQPTGQIALFPRLPSLAPEGTIFPAPPLELVHFECYQSHKFMRTSKNTVGPVGCMMCQKQEPGQRWRCTWCCMGACGSCMEVLVSTPNRDLKSSLQRIGVNPGAY